ncbi:ABC transporter permease [Emticicia soli]|uniref:ABC transporter permease n=1 Tax=Emticicia soli TaxID=2027878 RepID=A0ABW5J2K9_9BACT
MIRNYLKIAFRNLLRSKTFSFINIFGLSVGLATCLLIMLYVIDELSYDKHHKDGAQIFRVALQTGDERWSSMAAPVAQGIKKDFAEVEETTRLLNFPNIDKVLLTNEKADKQFYETNAYYVDNTFFNIFTYDFKYGNGQTALNQPNTIVISETVANKIFGNENPVDKVINVEIPYGKLNYTIKGVFRDKQQKSHIDAHLLLSMQNGDIGQWVNSQTNWAVNSLFHTYIKLKPGTNVASFERKLPSFWERNGGTDMRAINVTKTLFLQPLHDIYLKSAIGNEISANGSMTYVYIFSSIAAFLLLIACINFMNLSTARSEKRAKEVGVRKVMGANKNALVKQFLGESLIMSFIALFIALLLVQISLPAFNSFTQKSIDIFKTPSIFIWISGLTIVTAVLAGLYPSFYLSSFKPIAVLKGRLINSISATFIRKGLVVFQFTISVTLILVTMVIWRQMSLIRNQDLGFNKDHQLIIPFRSAATANNYTALKNEVLKKNNVISATAGTSYPGIQLIEDQFFYAEGKSLEEKVDINFARVNDDYIETLGYKVLYGRSFSKNPKADSNAIILNESAVKQLGYTAENAVGKKINYEERGQILRKEIVGVVKDFNFHSLHEAIGPYGMVKLVDNQHNFFIAHVQKGDFESTIADIEQIWKKINPASPFEYYFLDQDFQKNYQKEEKTSGTITYFMLITIFIACLGLFGLAAFSAEQRTKEIGVRKVLGATVGQIIGLFSKDFMKLVIIACAIAFPAGYWLMRQWLKNFAYQIELHWWIYLIAGLTTLLIAFLTVSYQAAKAALTNPIKSLKSE